MSRFVVGNCRFESLADLIGTLEGLFGEGTVERSVSGDNELIPYGYHGDSRVGEIGKVAAVVRREHIGGSSNDLPVIRNADGSYQVATSDYDVGHIPRRLGWKDVKDAHDLANRVKQILSVQQAIKAVRKLGYSFEQKTDEHGGVHITAKRYVAV